ncbi:manganese catalase family protein [Paracoccus sp. S-4012]|uniref:manganese catalase family protein n=1 Tax=Paracoccus sp. S-4012 TaxID=2665648 RepID=UPI0012B07FD1|nr:manganese catalase family protein [Paracoccus sp. S-4012]MRX49736.1 manganese catalase family protein [Paracoccus sp. S-4012]
MFMRVDRLQTELPPPKKADPNAAAALQELMGGKYGEMSTLGNYLFQSFNFRSKSKLKPFYHLVAAITAEELGHVELVGHGVAMLANGPDKRGADEGNGGDISRAPFEAMKDIRSAASFFSYGGGAVPVNSNSMSWNNDMVTTTGNVIFDLLHNFHLECGARLHKLRVYESLTDDNATGREVCGYLLVRGSVHAHAYALALKKLTGIAIEQMLPTPNIPLDKVPECQKYLQEGSHRRLYTFSTGDFQAMRGIWEGETALPDDPPGDLVVVEGMPDGGKIHDLTGEPSAFSPDYAPEEMFEIAEKLTKAAMQGAGSL